MAPRLPVAADFPASLNAAVVESSPKQPPTNVLVLLHGLGDTAKPFETLARQLNLPQTAYVVLQAPTPLPFDLGGFHWGDDIIVDQSSGSIEFDAGFRNVTKSLEEDLIRKGLLEKCGYSCRNIVFFGLGQGAMACLATLAKFDDEFGGLVNIGAPLPSDVSRTQSKRKTPILVLGGSSKSLITDSAVKSIRDAFSDVRAHQWRKSGDSMPANRDEMLPIMQFFAERLRTAAPRGTVEVG